MAANRTKGQNTKAGAHRAGDRPKQSKAGSKTVQLDVPAKIKNSRTIVPLRFVSEARCRCRGSDYIHGIYYNIQNDLLSIPLTSEAQIEIEGPKAKIILTM